MGDIGTAEELAQDALVAALEQWPADGMPERPGAWLMGTAKHRAIDLIRRRKTLERKHEEIGREAVQAQEGLDLDIAVQEHVGDDLLGLIFIEPRLIPSLLLQPCVIIFSAVNTVKSNG